MTRAWFLLALLATTARGGEPEGVRPAIARAVSIVNKAAAGHAENRECFSCHQQSLPLLAFAAAGKSGITVEAGHTRRQLDHTIAFVDKNQANYLSNKGTGGQVDTAGHILLGLAAAGHPPDANTDAIVHYLLKRQAEDGHWNCSSDRPPSEASNVTTTWLASAGLKAYGGSRTKETAPAIDKALDWFRAVTPRDNEEHAFRLMGLRACGECPCEIDRAAAELLALQKPDGGWSQRESMASDAYATGTALAALELPDGNPARAKAFAWLLSSQKPDGSWHVVSRSKPFQKYFETGFPHGKDQWISSTATAWAIVALSQGAR